MNPRAAPFATCALVLVGCGGSALESATAQRPPAGSAESAPPTTTDPPTNVAASSSGDTGTSPLSEPKLTLMPSGPGTSALTELTITRSRLTVDASEKARSAWKWLAVVRNGRRDFACDLAVNGEFLVEGAPPVTVHANVAAPPYRREGTSSVFRCVAPGDVGVASASLFTGARSATPEHVTEIRYAIGGMSGSELTPSEWVTLGAVHVVATERGRVVRGNVANGSRRMPFWETTVYPFDAEHTPLTEFVLRDPRTGLAPGETWAFETPPFDAPFDGAYVFVRHGRAQ